MSDENKTPLEDQNNGTPNPGAEQQELEQLASLFQQEYDKAKEEAETEPQYASHGWDTESHDYPIPAILGPEDLCVYCGERPRDKTLSSDNEACETCRASLTRYPLPVKSFVALAAVLVGFLFSLYLGIIALPTDIKIAQADSLLREHRLNAATQAYFTLYSENTASGNLNTRFVYNPQRITRQSILLAEKTGQPSAIPELYASLPKSVSFLPQFKKVKTINDQTAAFMEALEQAYDIIASSTSLIGDAFPYDKSIADLDALMLTFEEQTYPAHRKAAALYYKYTCTILAQKDLTLIADSLRAIQELLPDSLWLYAPYLGDAYARLSQYDEAMALAKLMKKQNKDDLTPYAVEAVSYRMQKQYTDAIVACDAGLALLDKSATTADTSDVSRQKAIALLLDGRAAEAVTALKQAAETNRTLQNYDTLAICALAAKDTATFNEITELFNNVNESNGLTEKDANRIWFGQYVLDYQKGTKTLEDIFLTGRADVR